MDNKTMATKSKEVNPTIEVATDIASNELEARIGADVYADLPSSQTKSYETYSKRIGAVSDALGCKDSVKG
jgi:hypothetical protein